MRYTFQWPPVHREIAAAMVSVKLFISHGKFVIFSVITDYIITVFIQSFKLQLFGKIKIIEKSVKHLTFIHTADIMHAGIKYAAVSRKCLQASSQIGSFFKNANIIPFFA